MPIHLDLVIRPINIHVLRARTPRARDCTPKTNYDMLRNLRNEVEELINGAAISHVIVDCAPD